MTGYEGKPFAFTFVNAHLAAFDEMFDKRNSDFHDLSRRLYFDATLPASAQDENASPTGSWYTPAAVPLTIFETDVLFWLVSGDCSGETLAIDKRASCCPGGSARCGLGWCVFGHMLLNGPCLPQAPPPVLLRRCYSTS